MRSRTLCALLLILTQLITPMLWSGPAGAATYPQPPAVSPFTTTGFIQAATLDNGTDVMSGGTVTVNSTKIVIPRNTVVIMSASNISWQEVWAFAPCPWGLPAGSVAKDPITLKAIQTPACADGTGLSTGNGQSGLALADRDATGKPPLTTYEITILGNRIVDPADGKDKYVAGLVYMAQQSLNLSQGIINYIDYTTGTLHVGCTPLGTACLPGVGTRIQINDPIGRYGRINSPDPRWTADTDNPTIRAKTGYPMCIPRFAVSGSNAVNPSGAKITQILNPGAMPPGPLLPLDPTKYSEDPLCPQSNRPLDPAADSKGNLSGYPLGNFTLCNPGTLMNVASNLDPSQNCYSNTPPPLAGIINAAATVFQPMQALPPAGSPIVPGSSIVGAGAKSQAPFQVGDYIDYSGTIQVDTQGTITGVVGGQYVSAWQIIANIGIFTVPSSVPAYIAQELLLQGVGGSPITFPIPVPQEQTSKIKTVGFFTDPTRLVDLYSVVVDPCTGAENDSLMMFGIPQDTGFVPWGRFRQVDQQGLFPISRQWRARIHPIFSDPKLADGVTPAPVIAANGLTAMQFTAPVSTFITPENIVFGDPQLLAVPQNFQNFPFLVQGEGPWRGDANTRVGTLAPFPLTNSIPGLVPPAPTSAFACPTGPQPVAVITPTNQTVSSNANVTLNASGSFDPTGAGLAFAWVQNSGPTVALTGANTSTPTFKAPNVSGNTALTFIVTVTDSLNQTSTASTIIEVVKGNLIRDTLTLVSAVYRANRGVLNVAVNSSDTTCSAILTMTAKSNGTPVLIDGLSSVTMQNTGAIVGGCSYTYVSSRSVFPAPTTIGVVSSLGGTLTAPVQQK
jgi:K319-like protein